MAELAIDELADELVGVFRDPAILIGIPLALLGAVFMSFGAQYQHRGVQKVERMTQTSGGAGLTGGQLLNLLRRPSWVVGTVMLGLAIVCQLSALSFAPLILVQPVGAISLVITTLLNARISGHRPTRRSVAAIAMCVGGVFIFVTIAALYATETAVSDQQLITILLILAGVMIVLAGLWIWLRDRMRALFYIVAAGIVYGFVATLAKVVINRIQNGDFEWLTVVCVVALLAGTGIGAYFVQTAYASGPPDLVIAGLTVIDPMVAIVIGLTVLAEAANAPLGAYIGFAVAGALAVAGVFQLARYHPEVVSNSQELPIPRGSTGSDDPDAVDPQAPKTRSVRLTETVSKVWPDPPVDDDRDLGKRR
ncbi:MAG: DMT family transporter [Candidatus Microbacterium phytovorans]|uniref:DMT family transporter n=1 Tax=Candidatus Microbacterium phytovorans TaxID=3121374 RepID=A0AAJ6B661_9MICO|nr:DMT family transporter [Microbacterium sp.]WEK14406.1 MAG: DMT family transporter [Microbacterium sp.]